jgi:predicted membrane protein
MHMRKFLGTIIVLLGLGLLLQQLNVSWARNIMELWWPLVIIAVGLLAWNGNRRQWFGPMLIVFIGVALLLDDLNAMSQSAWNFFWPIVIICFGGSILIGKSQQHTAKEIGSPSATAVFSGVDRRVTGSFDKGDVSAWFGGVKLDLRDAQFADATTLNVSAGFGGIEVWVPKNVSIVTKITPIMGGAEDKTHPDANAGKTLTITGSALFGGVTVKN